MFLCISTVRVSVFVLQQVGRAGTEQTEHVQRAGDLGDDLWTENSYIKDIRKTAQTLNLTNCWLCMHMPGTGKGGVILHGIPLTRQMMVPDGTIETGPVGGAVTNKVFIQLRETAYVCFKRSVKGGPFLGDWEKCNKTFEMPATCFNHSIVNAYECKKEYLPFWKNYCQMCASDNTYHKHLKYFPLPDGLWLLCGDDAYQQWPKNWSGVCTIGFVIPVIYKLEGLPIGMRIRNREVDSGLTVGGNLWTQISRAAIPPLGIAMNYRDIHILNNFTVAMFNDTIRSIKMLNEEVSEIRQVTLQNRYALDIMLAAKGGVCALIHSHCCVFIHNYEPNITRTVHDMEDRIAEHEAGKDGFNKSLWALLWDWLPDSSWLRLLLQLVVIIVIILIMLCCCIQCIPNLFQMCTSAFQRMGPGREGTVYYATKTPPIFE
uniref:Uncharacterized protein n=1 Tax=Pseudonaja textilis TaxID=8673 RepID=A0A670XRW5_PSETE